MRTRLAALAAVIAMVGLAACGDDNGSDSSGSDGDGAPVSLPGDVNDEGTEDATGASELELEADDFSFGPTYIKATPGTTLAVTVGNEGDVAHTFTIDDQGVDEEFAAGDSVDAEVTVPDDGIVNFYCRFHRGQGMQGAVFTEEGATGGGGGTDGSDDTGGRGY